MARAGAFVMRSGGLNPLEAWSARRETFWQVTRHIEQLPAQIEPRASNGSSPMNRAARRHQEKLARQAAKTSRGRPPPSPGQELAGGPASDLMELVQKGVRLHQAGQLQEAGTVYRMVLDLDPDQADANHLLGVLFSQVGSHAQAVELISRAIAMAPDQPTYHSNLGTALQELGRLEEAVAAHHRALAINPDSHAAHNNLGRALKAMGKNEEAVASYRRALDGKPDSAETNNNLGNVLDELGRLDEAVASYRKAREIRPDYVEAHYNLAEVLEKANRTEALREAVAVAKQDCPDHPRLTLAEAWLLRRDGDCAAARAVLEAAGAAVADAGFLSKRAHLLGELNDRLGDSEAAYRCYADGNRRLSDTAAARLAAARGYAARVDTLLERFSPDWVASWRSPESADGPSGKMVFLVGFPRSGTTLLESILRSHDAVDVVEEIPAVLAVREALEGLPGGYPDGLAALGPAELEALRKIYFAELDKHLAPEGRGAVVVDKLPMNMVEAGLIHRIFPQARFLFVQRHPCDCVLSCFMQNFTMNEAMVNFLDLAGAARLYDKVMTLWRTYQEALPLAVHTVRYESLIEADRETLAPIFDTGYPLRSRDVNMLGWRTRHPIPKAGSTTRAP